MKRPTCVHGILHAFLGLKAGVRAVLCSRNEVDGGKGLRVLEIRILVTRNKTTRNSRDDDVTTFIAWLLPFLVHIKWFVLRPKFCLTVSVTAVVSGLAVASSPERA